MGAAGFFLWDGMEGRDFLYFFGSFLRRLEEEEDNL